MADDVAARKQAMRATVRAALAALFPSRRALEEDTVAAAIQATPEWRAARTVLLYAAKPPEFSVVALTLAAWREGKATLFPRVTGSVRQPARPLGADAPVREPPALELCEVAAWSDLLPGAFGIREPAGHIPATAATPDLAVVPGVAFDAAGHRLGRGGGYYDALLPQLPKTRRWAVGFDAQLVAAVPCEAHDATVDDVWICRHKRLLGS